MLGPRYVVALAKNISKIPITKYSHLEIRNLVKLRAPLGHILKSGKGSAVSIFPVLVR